MAIKPQQPWGYAWRSSRLLILSTGCLALFMEEMLYTYPIPILPYMLEDRLHTDPSETQSLTTALLAVEGLVALLSAPIIAHYADELSDRRVALFLTLVGCFSGTFLFACCRSVWLLVIGRIIQGVSGAAVWIVCFAMLADNVPQDQMGQMMGWAMSSITGGLILGPALAGALLEWRGYWFAWSAPLLALMLDLVPPLVMIEKRQGDQGHGQIQPVPFSPSSSSSSSSSSGAIEAPEEGHTETSPLLLPPSINDDPEAPKTNSNTTHTTAEPEESPRPSGGFYRIMLRDPRVLYGLANTFLVNTIGAAFQTTLPLHLIRSFNWGTFAVGLVFLGMQVPSLFLEPIAGWVRDRVGVRYPATIGWALFVPLMWLFGVPGSSQFPAASPERNGQAVIIACSAAMGVALPLVRGVGPLCNVAVANEYQAKWPGIFGPNGGNSRIFSMNEVSFNLSLIIGPVLSSSLVQTVGYYYMNVVLALICLVMSVLCFFYSTG